MFINYYTCPECDCEWEDEYECWVDDDCPECGMRHISPHSYDDANHDYEAATEKKEEK